MDETTFAMLSSTDKPSALQLRQKIEHDKLAAFYRHWNGLGDPYLVDTDWFKLINIQSQATLIYFLLLQKLAMTFGGTNVMKSVLNLDETQPAMEQPFKATARFKRQLPTDIEVECVPLIKFHP